MRQARTYSSFDGIIHEIPEVSVDNFQNTNCKAYFLSHCHTDHTSGLFSEGLLSHLKRNHVYVYMSERSAAIIKHECGINTDIMEYIKPLDIGVSTTVTIPGNRVTEWEEYVYLHVEVIPAGHCLGSVMFLFRTLYSTVLYTGDFRLGSNDVHKYAQLHDGDGGRVLPIDALYIDTTFQNASHAEFPKRSESVHAAVREMRRWLRRSRSHRVAIHTSAKYGYEFVYNQVYRQLAEKVYVGDHMWNLYSQFPKSVSGVTNDASDCRIHTCRNRTETKPHDGCLPHQLNDHYNYLYIHFSAMKWTNYQTEDSVIEVKKDNNHYRIDVCFATHCSRSELEYFVNYLSPKRVVGFPHQYIGRQETRDNRVAEEGELATSVRNKSTQNTHKFIDRKLLKELLSD